FAYIKKNGISVGNQYFNTLRSAFNVSPLLPVYDDNGDFFNTASTNITDQNGDSYWNNAEANPYASMVYNNQNLRNTQKLVSDIYAIIEPIEHLTYRTSLSIDYYSEDYRSYTPEYKLSIYSFTNHSKVEQNMEKGHALSFDQTLSYDRQIGNHKITGLVGMWGQKFEKSWMKGENTDLAFNDFEHAWLSNATNTDEASLKKLTGAPEENEMLSYFGRLQYNYNETYMFNGTFRADGSSRFAKNHRWGYFPSISAGWVISNEPFMEPVANILNFMKLRASWGQVGNQNIGNFQYLAPIQFTQATYAFGNTEGTNTTGAFPSRLSNEEIKWETSEQLDFGFDARLLNSQLSVNLDWYKKTTKDWLIVAPVLATAGTDAPYKNGGNVNNTGIELGLTYNNKLGDFNYSVNVNGSYNHNNVTDIPTVDHIIHGATNTLYANSTEFYRAESGHPIGYFWGYQTNGLFQNSTDVLNYKNTDGIVIQPDAKPGDVRYIDQNNDGRINNDDKVEIGDPNPDFTFGLNFTCDYKGFDLLVSANGMAGNQIVQSYRSHTDKYANYSTEILDRWKGEGTSDRIPRVTNTNINYQFSDLFIQNGDFLRISNVTLGYDVANIIKLQNFSQCRIYASAQNLYTFTKYTGMDPEVGYGFDNGDTDKFSSGVDLGFYPRPRTVLLGVSLKF
ncbi:MAG: SusC/RagA family TonB-linked outer membrane protein, partial [Salinivirgaceae bacterium]|nr:SusC/RagA family TonB-linked outer membrane protein [Salinivirgaceae bacterium]